MYIGVHLSCRGWRDIQSTCLKCLSSCHGAVTYLCGWHLPVSLACTYLSFQLPFTCLPDYFLLELFCCVSDFPKSEIVFAVPKALFSCVCLYEIFSKFARLNKILPDMSFGPAHFGKPAVYLLECTTNKFSFLVPILILHFQCWSIPRTDPILPTLSNR